MRLVGSPAAFLALLLLAAPAVAQNPGPHLPTPAPPRLVCDAATRIADPKLDGGAAQISFRVAPIGVSANAVVEVLASGAPLVQLWTGTLLGGAAATSVTWDGRDAQGLRCPTGAYTMRVSAPGLAPLELPLNLVRLGVTELEAQDSPGQDDEFQMVYFMKDQSYAFYATPAIHEYLNVARAGEASDLDLNDGEPRPAAPVHTGTASPVLDGANYDDTTYNYPLAYVMGSRPRVELTFGASATAANGAPMSPGYPVPGYEIRVQTDAGAAVGSASRALPGATALVDLPALPLEVGRTSVELVLRWEARAAGSDVWQPIPGTQSIPLRIYTLLGPPQFKAGASGTQYSGPWVEVAEYISSWKDTLNLPTADQLGLTEVHIKGFFGQNGGIPTAIEGVVYDAYPLGGDGGATHYLSFSTWNMGLARLLNAHASGKYVNCSDNMGATTTMLSMMGATGVRPVRLGYMSLRAIWGIGAPDYTLNLWGGSHSFSYHHIVTDDDAVTVSDSCMQLDEDGNASALPGTPGWNVRRLWAGANGYMDLAANNTVSKNLELLPGLQ